MRNQFGNGLVMIWFQVKNECADIFSYANIISNYLCTAELLPLQYLRGKYKYIFAELPL